MKNKILHIIFFIISTLFSNSLVAQTINVEEEKDLEFQNYFFEALKQKAIQNYDKAIENLEKCYQIDSLSIAVEFELSKNYALLNRNFEAQIFIDKALVKEPKNIYLLQQKVAVLKAQYNYKEAIDVQKDIIKIQPNLSDELVLLYLQYKDFNSAEKLLNEIEENALSTLKSKSYREFLENSKNNQPKKEQLTVLKTDNKNLQSLKQEYAAQKNFSVLKEILVLEEQEKLYELLYEDSLNGLELYPAQPIIYLLNGLALNNLEKYNEAISVLTIGIDFVIDNNKMEANFYDQLVISYTMLNNKNEALKYKQKATQLRNKTE